MVKVVDYGVARLDVGEGFSAPHLRMGTPEYMAPERLHQPGDIRSDIYAVGVVLYELLEGRPPFRDADARPVLAQHQTAPPPPLSDDVAPSVAAIVARCLAKEPGERYQTPTQLRKALEAALAEAWTRPR